MNRQLRWKRWLPGFVSLLALVGAGCGPVLSEAVRLQAEPSVSFAALQANPKAYQGRLVILGGTLLAGTIARGRNKDTITYLEVLQHRLDHSQKPSVVDDTEGPFLLRCDTYFDLNVYAKGRQITVAGRVIGAHTGRIGERTYTYPLLTCQELHLWPLTASSPALYVPHSWWYGAPWLSDDYWDAP